MCMYEASGSLGTFGNLGRASGTGTLVVAYSNL